MKFPLGTKDWSGEEQKVTAAAGWSQGHGRVSGGCVLLGCPSPESQQDSQSGKTSKREPMASGHQLPNSSFCYRF